MRSDAAAGRAPRRRLSHQLVRDSKPPERGANVAHLAPAFMVIIYGIDVTEDVLGLDFNATVDATPGEATITLNSTLGKWEVTPRNLGIRVMTGDSRLFESSEYVEYGGSEEVPGATQELDRRGVDGGAPFSRNVNVTGGAPDHSLGVRDAWGNPLFATNEVERAWKEGRVLVRRLSELDEEGRDTGEPLGYDGRFRLDPFDGRIPIGTDNWREMFDEATRNPELYRYSEFKKFLVYSVKSNVLYAHGDGRPRTSVDPIGDEVASETPAPAGTRTRSVRVKAVTVEVDVELGFREITQLTDDALADATAEAGSDAPSLPDSLRSDSVGNVDVARREIRRLLDGVVRKEAAEREAAPTVTPTAETGELRIVDLPPETRTVESEPNEEGNVTTSRLQVFRARYSMEFSLRFDSGEVGGTAAASGSSEARTRVGSTGISLRNPFRVGDPVFGHNDPVMIFERSMYPIRQVDDDGQPFDDHVWFHAFTGYVTNVQKSGSPDERTLSITCGDMKRLLQDSKLAVKPSVVEDRNLGVADGLTVLSQRFANSSARDVVAELIQARGPTGVSPGVPLSTDVRRAERLVAQLAGEIDAIDGEISEALRLADGIGDSITLTSWLSGPLRTLTQALSDGYAITLRVFARGSALDSGIIPLSDLDGGVNGIPILGSIGRGLIGRDALGAIASGASAALPSASAFASTFSGDAATDEEWARLVRAEVSVRDAGSVDDLVVVAFMDPESEPAGSFRLSRTREILSAGVGADARGMTEAARRITTATRSDMVMSRGLMRWIEDDQFRVSEDAAEIARVTDAAYSRCISRGAPRIVPYARSAGGVGNYGLRVTSVRGAMLPNGRPDLGTTAKQFQAVFELNDMHPRYRNPDVIRDTFAILQPLLATRLADFSRWHDPNVVASGIRRELESLLDDGGGEENWMVLSLSDKFFKAANDIGSGEVDVGSVAALAPFVDDPSVSEYAKATMIDVLVKNAVESGYLHIVEPQGFLSSSFHPYNLETGDISLFESDIRDRLDVISEVADNLGLLFYVTPRGDFVLHPPLYPFSPRNFSVAFDERGSSTSGGNRLAAGLFNKQYVWESMHVMSTNWADNADSIVNAIEVHGSFSFLGTTDTGVNPYRALIKRDDLIRKYGLRYETIDVPGEVIHGQDQAAAYAYFQMQKRNREARTLAVSGFNCPSILLARPIEVTQEYTAGYVRSIDTSWSPDGGATKSIEIMDPRSLYVSPRSGNFILATDFERVEYLNYASFWTQGLEGGTENVDAIVRLLTSREILGNAALTNEEAREIASDPTNPTVGRLLQAYSQLFPDGLAPDVGESIAFRSYDVSNHVALAPINAGAASFIKELYERD